jgi:hypothetical protein
LGLISYAARERSFFFSTETSFNRRLLLDFAPTPTRDFTLQEIYTFKERLSILLFEECSEDGDK